MPAPDRPRAWGAFLADVRRYMEPGWPLARKLRALFANEGPLISALFRSGNWIYFECPRWLATPLKLLWKPADLLVSTVFDTHLYPAGTIGPGLYIGHHGGIFVNPNATIGANCNINPGSVIGVAGSGARSPVIGDRVWIGPHAVITGGIRVGDGAVIGANSLVTADVPPMAVVVGVPARTVMFTGSSRLIRQASDAPAEPVAEPSREGGERVTARAAG